MTDDLVKRLRSLGFKPYTTYFDAADAIERLTRERDEARGRALKLGHERAKLYDKIVGTPCAEIRWQQEREVLNARAEAAERKVDVLREALKGVLLDVDFMVERDVIPDIRNDIIYERARAALKETEIE